MGLSIVPPFLSSLTDTTSQGLLQYVNVLNPGPNMSKEKEKTQTNLSWRLFQSLLASAYIAQNATNYRPFYCQPWVYDACWCCTFTVLAAGIRLAFPCSWCLREDSLSSGWSLQPSLNRVNKNGFCFALPMKGCHASRLEVHRPFGQTRLIQEPFLVGLLFWSQSV